MCYIAGRSQKTKRSVYYDFDKSDGHITAAAHLKQCHALYSNQAIPQGQAIS